MTCPSHLGTKRRINYSNRNQKSTYYFESILTLYILKLLNMFIIQLFAIFSRCILSESMFGFNVSMGYFKTRELMKKSISIMSLTDQTTKNQTSLQISHILMFPVEFD